MNHYEMTSSPVTFGEITLSVSTVADFDALLDYYAETHGSDVEMIPYYARLWKAAEALASFIAERHTTMEGMHVVEMGCGLGVPSLLCGALGATVVASDFHPDNRPLMEQNIRKNGLERRISYALMDWRELPSLLPEADLVIASDVLYDRNIIAPWTDAASRLARSHAPIYLADPGRSLLQEAVLDLEGKGFSSRTHVIDEAFVVEFEPAPATACRASNDAKAH
jgi:predicted nicotinamide N-methyase